MKKKYYAALLAVVVIAFTGYNVYQSQKADASLSDLAMANVEALANGELSNGNCEGSWSQECCKCDYIHYTYACAIEVTGNSCYTVSGCSHYTKFNKKDVSVVIFVTHLFVTLLKLCIR